MWGLQTVPKSWMPQVLLSTMMGTQQRWKNYSTKNRWESFVIRSKYVLEQALAGTSSTRDRSRFAVKFSFPNSNATTTSRQNSKPAAGESMLSCRILIFIFWQPPAKPARARFVCCFVLFSSPTSRTSVFPKFSRIRNQDRKHWVCRLQGNKMDMCSM